MNQKQNETSAEVKRTLSIGKTIDEEIAFVKQMIDETRQDGLHNIADYIWIPELLRLLKEKKA